MAAKVTIRNNRIIITNPLEYLHYDAMIKILSTWDKLNFSVKDTYVEWITNGKMVIPRYFTKEEGATFFKNVKVIRDEDYYVSHIAGVDFKWKDEIKMKNGLQVQAIQYLHNNKNAVLNTQPGSGKTVMVLKHIANVKVKTLIVMEKKMVAHWKKKIAMTMDLKKEEILHINGNVTLNKILDKKIDVEGVKIFIATHTVLANLIDAKASKYDDLLRFMKIGMWIVDESHKRTRTLFKLIARSDIKYNIFLTATVSRKDFKEKAILNRMLPLARFNEQKANTTISKHITFIFDSYTTNPDPEKIESIQEGKWGMDVNKWAKWLNDYGWEEFSDKLLGLLVESLNMTEYQGKIIFLFNRISMIDRFVEDLENFIDKLGNPEMYGILKIGKVYGEFRDDLQDVQIIVGTDSIFRDGMDIDGLRVLINTVPFSNDTVAIQTAGRLREILGKSTVYVDLIDTAFPKMKTQRYARKRQFKKYSKQFIVVK